MEWPRIPVPGWPDGDEAGAAEKLARVGGAWPEARRAAGLGYRRRRGHVRACCVPRSESSAVPSTTDGSNMSGDDFDVTAGWGHFGSGQAVMPGQGRVNERPYTSEEARGDG